MKQRRYVFDIYLLCIYPKCGDLYCLWLRIFSLSPCPPCFVVQFLSDKDVGASVICPSSKGPSCLILTLKIYDGVYTQKEIVEDRKDQKASLLTLGTTLRIDKDSFEDLDEVSAFLGNLRKSYFSFHPSTSLLPYLFFPFSSF